MAEDVWEIVNVGGIDYWQIETTRFLVPVDWVPGSKMFIAVAAATGQGNFPAAVKGEQGDTPTLDTIVNLTALDYDDPDPDGASFTETSPGTYQLNLTLHKGPQGADGDTVLDPTDFGTPVYKKILVVNAAADDFEYQSQKVGDRYVPATISNTPSGNPAYTLCPVGIPAQDFDWRPHVEGQTIVTGSGSNVRVDVIARLNDATSGNIVGRGFGVSGAGPATVALSSGPPPGSADSYDKVSAGAAATVYLRAERQSGTDTFTTSGSTTTFSVEVRPVP